MEPFLSLAALRRRNVSKDMYILIISGQPRYELQREEDNRRAFRPRSTTAHSILSASAILIKIIAVICMSLVVVRRIDKVGI